MRRNRLGAVVAMLLLALVAGCGGAESASSEMTGDDGGVAPDLARADGDAGGGAEEAAAGGGQGARAAVAPDVAPQQGTAALVTAGGDRIVRDGTIRLQVDDDVDGAFNRLTSLADRFGGTVLASESTTADDGTTSGSVTLRVPAEDYDALLVAVAGVGDVLLRSITSDDVSDEFVDLEARLRHNQAQERFYLGLLDKADSVEDAIAVQQRLEGIQQTIEQIQGRLRFLEERTSFSRLTVEVVQVGAVFQAGGAQPSLARYWATARAALVNVLGGLLVVTTVALPLTLLGLVIFVVGRRYAWPARRAATTPEA